MKTQKKPLKKSGRKAAKKKFPGYPPYPANEDILNQDTRVEGNLDDEVLTGRSVDMKLSKNYADKNDEVAEGVEDQLKPIAKNDADVTEEDLEALGPEDLSLDMGDDEQLKHRTRPVDFSGKDLDVPGAELDDQNEEIGSEDEENNSYSLGGENHQDLEDSRNG